MDIWRTRMVPSRPFLWVGIKDSPPYLHDGRLLTLEDSVEFIILVLGTQLTAKRNRTWWPFYPCSNCHDRAP
jgi:hypothetical protein